MSAYAEVATVLKTIIDTEFAPEGIVAIHDNLHPALGQTRVSVGIAPLYETVNGRDAAVGETWAEVRFYDLWKKEISPETVIDPLKINAYAERFKAAVEAARATVGTGHMWFFDVMRIEYPNDPTGNKSRFVATIRAFGNNTALIETS